MCILLVYPIMCVVWVCDVGLVQWRNVLKERHKLPVPKNGGVDVEIIRPAFISDILSRHVWMNWRWPQEASITAAIYKSRIELSTTWLRRKNATHSTATFGFLLHLTIIIIIVTIIIIIIIIIKVAELFRAFLESWLAIYLRGKQISAVCGTRMSTIVFSQAHHWTVSSEFWIYFVQLNSVSLIYTFIRYVCSKPRQYQLL